MSLLTTLANVKNYLGVNTGINISGITLANPCVVTAPNHNLLNGLQVLVNGVNGTVQLNGNTYTVTVVDQNTIKLNVDSTLFTAYVSGGYVSTDDILLTRLISSASDFIESWLNRRFDIETYTDVRDGTGTNRMMAANYPILSISNVTINNQNIQPSDGQSFGYRNDLNRIWLVGGTFSRGIGNVQVTYSAGYSTVPPAIEQGCIELVAQKYFLKDRIGVNSKVINGETVSYTQKDLRDDFKSVLANYTKVIPV
jgi:hypothetical protein